MAILLENDGEKFPLVPISSVGPALKARKFSTINHCAHDSPITLKEQRIIIMDSHIFNHQLNFPMQSRRCLLLLSLLLHGLESILLAFCICFHRLLEYHAIAEIFLPVPRTLKSAKMVV